MKTQCKPISINYKMLIVLLIATPSAFASTNQTENVLQHVDVFLAFVIGISVTLAVWYLQRYRSNQGKQPPLVLKEAEVIPCDSITNLPIMQRCVEVVSDFIKEKGASNAIVIAFKLVNFSQVNKMLGHQNSDLLLLQFAYKMQQALLENPLLVNFGTTSEKVHLCRLQGLDFAMLIDRTRFEHPDHIVLENLCKTLIKKVPKPISVKSCSLDFDLVIGISLGSEKHHATQMITEACDAITVAERLGQEFSFYEESTALHSEKQLVNMEKLRKLQHDHALTMLIQPQVALDTNTIKGFEIFHDWRAHFGQEFSKEHFYELAEYSGVIYSMTKQLISEAFVILSLTHQMGINVPVSINLTSKALLEPDLADFIETQADKNGVSANYLIIELNEKVLLDSAFRARMMVDQLKALGVNIAVDEFSGSYEALKYLRRAAVHQVKIDCSNIDETDGYRTEKTIADALVNLIRTMEITVVGIGVDRLSIKDNYIAIGGNIAQGKVIHLGLETAQLTAWCNSWQGKTKQA